MDDERIENSVFSKERQTKFFFAFHQFLDNFVTMKKFGSRVARFFFVQNTKTGRNITNDHKI
jgi:hypothetical protein